MRRRRCRPFSILDAMILVAATAVGLALARTIADDAFNGRFSLSRWTARPFAFFLLAWTLAFLPIRLRRPRPTLHRLIGQPGMAACCAVALVTAIDATSWAILTAQSGPNRDNTVVSRYWRLAHDNPGPAVAMTWLGLLLSRRWRPEPGWIDRLGRLIGVLWLLTIPCGWQFGRWTFRLIDRLARGEL